MRRVSSNVNCSFTTALLQEQQLLPQVPVILVSFTQLTHTDYSHSHGFSHGCQRVCCAGVDSSLGCRVS